jgi:hypothetical protein
MPQQTNLNVAPYFDDFDPTNDYHKVLFKPGYPVQARELSTLQSILQNQIERFGQHFFKEGAKVIPGNTGYSQLYYAVQLANTYQGVPVEAYVEQLIGSTITGQTSGVTATVDSVLFSADSERDNLTLYVAYKGSSTRDNATQTFSDGEPLISNQTISSGLLGNSVISPGTPFARTIPSGSSATGSVFQIEQGVYFVRGNFVNVNRESLILDQYTNTPSYRVGLFVNEEIVNANTDESLNDNSQGFNNYGAPGADRLKISLSLLKKSLTDFNDDNFIELATIINGVLQTSAVKRGSARAGGGVFFDDLTDVLARRTFDESGHYIVKPFNVSIINSLNNNRGNQGLLDAGKFTPSGGNVSDDLALCRVSPGKAYVKGYEIETIAPTFIDVAKPRATRTLEDQFFQYNTGPTLKLNSVYRSPTVGVGNTFVLSLRDQRVGVNSETAPGKEIGLARVFDFRLESGSYDTAFPKLNEWGTSLYDVQPFTELTLNQAITAAVPVYVEGESSGATGFLRHSVSAGIAVTVYDKKGDFIANEVLRFKSSINEGQDVFRTASSVRSYGIADVKSVYSNTGIVNGTGGTATTGINTFSANVVQSTLSAFNDAASVTAVSAGVATVTCGDPTFPSSLKVNDLVSFVNLGISSTVPIVARVTGTNATEATIVGVATVPGEVEGQLPSTVSALARGELQVLTSTLDVQSDGTLYTPFPKENIASVDLTDSSLTIRKSFTIDITSNQIAPASLIALILPVGESYLPFTDERYTLTRSDGLIEVLTADRFSFSADGREIQIRNLGANDTGATLTVSVEKRKVKSKKKIKNRVSSLVIDQSSTRASGIGSTTLNDGLTYGNFPFGTRVQDKVISLNAPDIIEIHGIYESTEVNPTSFGAPSMEMVQLNGPTATVNDFIIGELLVGQTSGASAVVAEVVNNSTLRYISKNNFKFVEGETVIAQETEVGGVISDLDTSAFDVSTNFTYSSGQGKTFYNHGFLTRKSDSDAPSKRIKVYFKSASFDTADTGDIVNVDSYNDFDYSTEVKAVNGYLNTDLIDLRPRVTNYTTATGTRSPLEFLGRSFNGVGSAVPSILASNENIFLDYSYYQGRIDRLYLNKDGKFQMKFGTPSDDPQRPNPVDNAIEIATIKYPPYLHNVQQASINYLKYKRFQMKDIKKLEDRIRSLEYYTSLSMLESNTANMFIPDADGLNRFKSGFFVDNFTSFKTQDYFLSRKYSIDQVHKLMRPSHYTTSVDLMTGPVVDVDPTEDKRTANIEGINIRKQSDIVSLEYSEVEYVKQTFATRTESVTPFLISFWQGTIELVPSSDNWVTQNRVEAKTIEVPGNYADVMAEAEAKFNVDPQTGFAATIWNSWETSWSGMTSVVEDTRRRTDTSSRTFGRGGWINGGSGGPAAWVRQTTSQTVEETVRNTTEEGTKSRTGSTTMVVEEFEEIEVGDKVLNSELITTVRSRNVEFYANNLKPATRIYAFFDGKDVTRYCVPKLIEIEMSSGVFQVGETVSGRVISNGLSEQNRNADPTINFRVAQSNHRRGDYDAPTETYPNNPYTTGNTPIPEAYSSVSTTLNVDTYSLADQPQGDFFGYIQTGMVLVGETSGAEATVSNVRLITDISSALGGSFFIPDPDNGDNPKFDTGTNTFTLTNDPDNDQNAASTIGEEAYPTSGTLETVQGQIMSVRNARIENRQEFESELVNRTLDTEVVSSRNIGGASVSENIVGWYDPLAQSFLVKEAPGVFVTKCDIFFRTKDDENTPVKFQLRTMKDGFPTPNILPFSEVNLDPNEVNTSDDGTVATTIEFGAPVYLEGENTEYAICLISNSTKYSVYISRVGENDIVSDTYISNQPTLGSLFKSQNASTWEPSQWEDLKFTLYRAEFENTGSVELYSPQLSEGNKQIATLVPDPINVVSKQIRVGLGTTVHEVDYELGNTFFQGPASTPTATGDLVGVAASATGTLTITNPGIGYTPADGMAGFNGVNLVTVSGTGANATANVTIQNGVAIAATITGSGGNGYQVGDVLTLGTIGVASVGRNVRFTVAGIGLTTQLVLDNVQGDFIVGAAGTIKFFNSSGISTELNGRLAQGDVTIPSDGITQVSDGLHIKINHKNHGMNFEDNRVIISDVRSDVKPTKLTAAYDKASSDPIVVTNATAFSNFEGVGIGTTNTGLLLIGEEIIEYTSSTTTTLGGITRGTLTKSYPVGTPVFKYELGGVSLARINKTHALSSATIANPITLDSYHIKLDMSEKLGNGNTDSLGASNNADRSVNTPFNKLFIGGSKTAGGYNVKATQNVPFEGVKPLVHNMTVEGTTLTAQIRTVTSQSISGTEIPYVDAGFEDLALNQNNYFDSPRAIYSKVNEDAKLTGLNGNKSVQMRMLLGTTNTLVSPQIDLQRCSLETFSNRINSEITNYATDPRVNTLFEDPNACQYISKEVTLENPASAIRIMLDAHVNQVSDIRAFYSVSGDPGFEPIFTPFPGFANLNTRGDIINEADNNGTTNTFVPAALKEGFGYDNLEFREHVFEVDKLPSFRSYRIKIILASTSQVLVPKVKDLRVIAFA